MTAGPSYPNSVPTIATLTGSDYPQASHLNAPNREIEAIAQELGPDISTVDDTLAPVQSPLSVSQYKDMLAYIFKKWGGVSNWYSAAVPSRGIIWGHGSCTTFAAGSTNYVYLFASFFDSSEDIAKMIVPFACNVVSLRSQIVTAQPGTGSLVATLRKSAADTAITATHAAGASAMNVASGTGSVAYAAGNALAVKFVNNAATASGQIGCVSIQFNQVG